MSEGELGITQPASAAPSIREKQPDSSGLVKDQAKVAGDFEPPSFHAHVYYDSETMEQARAVCTACRDAFGIAMGRMHERPVGPHPDWSCQLTIPPDKLGPVLAWLASHREGLVVFCHPNGPDALVSHRDHAIWMGQIRPLALAQFERVRG